MHHLLTVHKDDRDVQNRTMLALGGMYHNLHEDYARAAFWWRQAGVEKGSGPQDAAVHLAECYWRLGNKQMAVELLKSKPPSLRRSIKLWADMGETSRPCSSPKRLARDGYGWMAYLYAGDACRVAGQNSKAIDYYQKVLAVTAEGNQKGRIEREQNRARASLEAIRLFELSDVRKVPDGTYRDSSLGYEGPVQVEVVVEGQADRGRARHAAQGEAVLLRAVRHAAPRSSPSRASRGSTPPAAPRSPPKRSSTPRPRRWPGRRSRLSLAPSFSSGNDGREREDNEKDRQHAARHLPPVPAEAEEGDRAASAEACCCRAARRVLPAAAVRRSADRQAGAGAPVAQAARARRWLSAPVRRVVQASASSLFLWLFFYVCWPYSARPRAELAAAGCRRRSTRPDRHGDAGDRAAAARATARGQQLYVVDESTEEAEATTSARSA